MRTAPTSDPEILQGGDDWLFLKEGTNKSLSYLTGALPIEGKASISWTQTIRKRQKLFPNCLHLICPEKLAVFNHALPDLQLDNKRFSINLAKIPGVLYPVDQLVRAKALGRYSYSKTDTHFSDLGGLVVARLVADHFGVKRDLDINWQLENITGDLGIKLNPIQKSEKLILNTKSNISQFDNGLKNRGRIICYKNPNVNSGRLLVFGDSFTGINLGRILAEFFQDILFIHSLSLDYRVVSLYRPDFVLFEFAERFLREPPMDGLNIEKYYIDRILLEDFEDLTRWRLQEKNITGSFVDWERLDYFRSLLLSE